MALTNESTSNDGTFTGTTPSGILVFVDPPLLPANHRAYGYSKWFEGATQGNVSLSLTAAQGVLDYQDSTANVKHIFDHVTVGFPPKGSATVAARVVLQAVYDSLKANPALAQADFTAVFADSAHYHMTKETDVVRRAQRETKFDVMGWRKKNMPFDAPGTIWSLCVEAVKNGAWT